MRIFAAIPHFFREVSAQSANNSGRAGSGPERLQALVGAITSLHQNFGSGVCGLDHQYGIGHRVNAPETHRVDIVLCTTGKHHLVERLGPLKPLFHHHATEAEPMTLGFECHRLLRDARGKYDYYCYIEDDILIHFAKRRQFDRRFGPEALLQPNRYEVSIIGPVHKLYVDYRLHRNLTAAYQNIDESPFVEMPYGDETILFERPSYPSAGCFFLNAAQLDRWVESPHFLSGDCSYLGSPLDSAATLSIMRTFRIYKSTLVQAGFFEVLHASPRWIGRPLKPGRPLHPAAAAGAPGGT